MTPYDFMSECHASDLKEHSSAQEHCIDQCQPLGDPERANADCHLAAAEATGELGSGCDGVVGAG